MLSVRCGEALLMKFSSHDLALLKQDYAALTAMCEPSAVSAWNPKPEQKARYVELLGRILDRLDAITVEEQNSILTDAATHVSLPNGLADVLRDQIEPNLVPLEAAFRLLDPDNASFYEAFKGIGGPAGGDGAVLETFRVGLEKVDELIESNPDIDFDFMPSAAWRVVFSPLFQFDPDSWLRRTAHLRQIKMAGTNADLPIHVRTRILEMFRVYVLGCWLSVAALARATLEYAILDNLNKLELQESWPNTVGASPKRKKLDDLIKDVSEKLPELADPMDKIRTVGNQYLHPNRTRTSKETLFVQEMAAQECIVALRVAVETLYRSTRGHT